MSDTLQAAMQNIWESTPTANRIFTTFVQPLFQSSIDAGTVVDVRVVRERTAVKVDFARNQPYTFTLNYDREQRHGSGSLSSNYLSNVTETPQVTEYLTQDAGICRGRPGHLLPADARQHGRGAGHSECRQTPGSRVWTPRWTAISPARFC